MKSLVFNLFFIFSLSLQAYNINDFESASQNQELQNRINLSTGEVIRGFLGQHFCQFVLTDIEIASLLGTSIDYSSTIKDICIQKKIKSNYRVSQKMKIWNRSFYFAKNKNQSKNIMSWTNQNAQTFVFKMATEINDQELKEVLTHELAILLDGKSTFMYTSYLILKEQLATNKTDIVINISDFDPNMKNIFNGLANDKVNLSLSTMRAYNIELLSQGIEPKTLLNPDQCIRAFNYWYKQFSSEKISLPDISFSSEVENNLIRFYSDLTKLIGNNEQVQLALDKINDKSFLIYDPQIKTNTSLCQFMARPLLSFDSVHNFWSNGPRPNPSDWACIQGEDSCLGDNSNPAGP